MPPTTTLWSREVLEVGVDEPGEVTVAVGAPEVAELDAVEVLFPVAAALKASNLSPGLTAKTIPCLQWFP